MKTTFHTLIVLACLLIAVLASADEASPLKSLADAEGAAYVAARDTLRTQPVVEAQEQMQPKLVLLQNLLRARQRAQERFAGFQAIIEQARSGLPSMTNSQTGVRRYLSLGTRLAQEAGCDNDALSLAMAELLWKTAVNDGEKRCAVHVLSLSDTPVQGVYQVLREELRESSTPALAEDILALLAKYVSVHAVGTVDVQLKDIESACRRFPSASSLHALSLKLLKDINTEASAAVAAEIAAIAAQNRSDVSAPTTKQDGPVEVDVK